MLSAIAPVRSSVYVVLVSRSLSKLTSTDLPLMTALGFFSRGGERKIPLASFIFTYSLKVKRTLVLCVGTLTVPGRGYILVISGGIVSFGPPVGGVVVLAQPLGNIMAARTIPAGISGRNLFSFIMRCGIRFQCLLWRKASLSSSQGFPSNSRTCL